jgi:hypothetical protein
MINIYKYTKKGGIKKIKGINYFYTEGGGFVVLK